MTVSEIRDFNFENSYKQIGFVIESSYSIKRLKKRLIIASNLINRKNS